MGPDELSSVFSGPDFDGIALPQASLAGMDLAPTVSVPEPASAAMLLLGMAALRHLRRRRMH